MFSTNWMIHDTQKIIFSITFDTQIKKKKNKLSEWQQLKNWTSKIKKTKKKKIWNHFKNVLLFQKDTFKLKYLFHLLYTRPQFPTIAIIFFHFFFCNEKKSIFSWDYIVKKKHSHTEKRKKKQKKEESKHCIFIAFEWFAFGVPFLWGLRMQKTDAMVFVNKKKTQIFRFHFIFAVFFFLHCAHCKSNKIVQMSFFFLSRSFCFQLQFHLLPNEPNLLNSVVFF